VRDDAIVQAGRVQNEASAPGASVFVSASAGSGKTKLLIDRLLRLMLPRRVWDERGAEWVVVPGSDPARIQCLTFTKAAAAEMAIRLQTILGRWVSMTDVALDRELAALEIEPDEGVRARARSLFVTVLDLPGGMRIGTIHAFCQSLLRRFPLEAAVNPHFALMEETDSRLAMAESVEEELASAVSGDVGVLARETGLADFTRRVAALRDAGGRAGDLLSRWDVLPERVRAAYGRVLTVGGDTEALLDEEARVVPEEERLRDVLRVMRDEGAKGVSVTAVSFLDWLNVPVGERDVEVWRELLLDSKGMPRAAGGFVRGKLGKERPELGDALVAEAERQVLVAERRSALHLVTLNCALLALAVPILRRYAERKAGRGMVDYDDLIAHTRDLLREPGAAWVLYKLDGGIDHLLLDEVQDTSRAQWEIAGALTEEFFAGLGAHDGEGVARTVFAVGDFKQSIYAFQGADPEAFHEWRGRFADMVRGAGQDWRTPGLSVSFRSVEPVLRLVDAVFEGEVASRGLREPGTDEALPGHRSARAGQGGRVELWPLVPALEKGEELTPWRARRDNAGQRAAPQRLAEGLARWIAAQIGRAPQEGQAPLRAGEVLVLVPRRSAFVRALIRALKTENVPVATLVRVELVDQVAVKDLMALCEALLLPQDDLTLGCVLTSPLGDVSDESLMALAMGREQRPLWTVLRERRGERPEWSAAWTMLERLYQRVDFATPYQLLAEALGVLGGRARLLRRLGPDAAEPVDELLSAALRFEALHPPSLQGFLRWLRASETTVKREPEAAADAVRVMTVHGAKGLQARLVVLPDMTGDVRQENELLWADDGELEVPVWVPRVARATGVTRGLSDERKRAVLEERNRLLYVALTRASDWLVVCGWEGKRAPADESWYALCKAGFERVGAEAAAFDLGWEGERLVLEAACVVPSRVGVEARAVSAVDLPDWMGRAPLWKAAAPREEGALTRPLAPSRPDGAQFGALPAARSPRALMEGRIGGRERALRRGNLVHRLLQVLPERPEGEWAEVARRFLARPAFGLGEEEIAGLVRQVLGVLAHPDLAPLFGQGSRAEQAITGIAGGQVVVGQVDRLRVTGEAIWLCDYKTNQVPPTDVARVPAAYVRQMAAYRAVLEQLEPRRPVYCRLVWTETASVMVLPEGLLEV